MTSVSAAEEAPPKAVAVLARWIAETVIALGVVPKALPELVRSQIWRGVPLQHGIHDLGLAGEPNLEFLEQLHLDLILVDGRLQSAWIDRLGRIAPVVPATIYTPERTPYIFAEAETLRLGTLMMSGNAAARYVDAYNGVIQASREALSDFRDRPVFVVRMIDARNVMLHCGGSIFHDVLIRLGIMPAASMANDWGFLTVGIETLAASPAARIVYFEPVPTAAERLFSRPSLWSHLPSVQEGLVTAIPELYAWGALPTAKRFAELLAERLPREGAG